MEILAAGAMIEPPEDGDGLGAGAALTTRCQGNPGPHLDQPSGSPKGTAGASLGLPQRLPTRSLESDASGAPGTSLGHAEKVRTQFLSLRQLG